MIRTTLKDIKDFSKRHDVTDLTRASDEQIKIVKELEVWLEKIAYSLGKYGVTGCIYRGAKTGELYTIAARNNNIYKI